MKTAVIGAGPAGLVSARELGRYGCDVEVFEASSNVGGVWVYDPHVEDDPLGQHSKHPVLCSLYESLRTNLPRDIMAFSDYTFDSAGGGDDSWPRFPHHTKVRQYLENFTDEFNLRDRIQFNSPVTELKQEDDQWLIASGKKTGRYDAVMICNGHYAKPRVPPLPGIEDFSGEVFHSHNYRNANGLEGLRVALWGTSASGFDLSNEIAEVAAKTYWCGNAIPGPVHFDEKRSAYPSPDGFDDKGMLRIGDERLEIDVFIYCTGYHYAFPFLRDERITVEDNCVSPLYQDLIHPEAPTLGFIGLPYLIVPFPVFEVQATWFTKQLTGGFDLPDKHSMFAAIEDRMQTFKARGEQLRHFHRLGDLQTDYFNTLAAQCGARQMPKWFTDTWRDAQQSREADPVNFRDRPLPVRGPTVVNV